MGVTPGGIDILILHGASLERITAALAAVCGLTADGSGLTINGIIRPDEDIMDRLDVLGLPLHARIHAYMGGDFSFKVDIDGLTPRDYTALAREMASALGQGVVIMDESRADPVSCILLHPDVPDRHGIIEDAEPDGFWLRTPTTAL
ncbi:MAG: hypothetical protein ACRCTD_05180 [Beijerinckiaceae bacterium]